VVKGESQSLVGKERGKTYSAERVSNRLLKGGPYETSKKRKKELLDRYTEGQVGD